VDVPDRLGDYEVEHELGRGGSGVVYAARRGATEVALKVLRSDEAATPKERERFLAEARNLAKVTHPAVVRVLAVGELPDGRPFLAMERLHGSTLAERLLMRRIPLEQALVLFEQLTAAVAALHAAGLVHRDIKPENIMLVDERIKLLDFGIARGTDDLPSTTTQAGLQRGTPAYMAPERFFGARATVSSDVYETAVVLYAMITGALPWDPRSAKERLAPKPPSAHGVEVPPSFEAALMAALNPEPLHRPQTIGELVASIRRAGWEGDTQAAPPTPPAPRANPAAKTERTRRRPLLIAGALVGVFGAAVAVAYVQMESQTAPSPLAAATPPDAAAVTPTDAGVVVAPIEVVAVPVDAAPAVDAAPVAPVAKRPAKRARKVAPTPAAPSAPATSTSGAALPACRKIAALYCTDDFRATEGTLAGKLCDAMTKNVADWEAFPEPARTQQGDWCRDSYDTMAAAVAERMRQYWAGEGPIKPPPKP
jgi:serine/threonine-protein kinase